MRLFWYLHIRFRVVAFRNSVFSFFPKRFLMSLEKINKQFTFVWSPDGVTQPLNNNYNQPLGIAALDLDGYANGTASFTTVPVSVGGCDRYSVVFSCPSTGTPSGTFALQGCDDKSHRGEGGGPDANLINWFPIELQIVTTGVWSSSFTVSGQTQLTLIDPFVSYSWVRGVYTAASGSLTVTLKGHKRGW